MKSAVLDHETAREPLDRSSALTETLKEEEEDDAQDGELDELAIHPDGEAYGQHLHPDGEAYGQHARLLDGTPMDSHGRLPNGRTSFQMVNENLNLLDPHTLIPSPHDGGGIFSAVSNMSNSIVGAGIIGLPFAIREAGFWTGLILLFGLTIVTDWSIRLIVLNAKLSGRGSYIDFCDHCFGLPGRISISFFQFAFAFGGMTAFGVIIGDTIPQVIRSVLPGLATIPVLGLLVDRRVVIFLCTMGVSYPLSLYRDIAKLSKASTIALVSMLIILFSVVFESPRVDSSIRGDTEGRLNFVGQEVFQAIGVISFAFVCQHNSLLIYGGLRKPTLDRFALIVHVSTGFSFIACLIMSMSGYLAFTNRTQGNILNNFPEDNILINIARLCFGLNMFTTLPLEAFVCREVIETLFFGDQPYNQTRHIILTTLIISSSLIISLLTCDLGIVLELTGGFSATALAYIMPSACFIRMGDSGKNPFAMKKWGAWACATFGLVVMVLSTFLALTKPPDRRRTTCS